MRNIVSMISLLSPAVLCLSLLAWTGLAHADDDDHRRSDQLGQRQSDAAEYDQLRNAVRDGKLLPLAKIKALVARRWPGEMVDVSISHEHGLISYELRILSPIGRLVEVEVNAATGAILEVENE